MRNTSTTKPDCVFSFLLLGFLLLGSHARGQGAVAGMSIKVAALEQLEKALANATIGTTIEIGEGTFQLFRPLTLKSGVTIKGAGIDKTTITNDPKWVPSKKSLPDPEVKLKGLDKEAYLV